MAKMIDLCLELALCKVGESQMRTLIYMNLTSVMEMPYLQFLMDMEVNK
jgi:hypothetical protein